MDDLTARTRSTVTLVVLAAVFLLSVVWAWSAVTEPFPDPLETPDCYDETVAAGDAVGPGDVLVHVLNAGSEEGLARDTMDQLVREGFAQGQRGNTTTAKGGAAAQIWTDEPGNPAVRLVLSYLGKDAKIVEQATEQPGVTVVVTDKFPGVVNGKRRVVAKNEAVVCKPATVE